MEGRKPKKRRSEGRKEGSQARRDKGMKGKKKEGRKEGRKEGSSGKKFRKEGRKEGRNVDETSYLV